MDTYAGGDPHKRQRDKTNAKARAFISVYWKCCNTFSRVYKNRQGSAYEGRCPRCATPVRAPVGDGGTKRRMFTAG